MSPAQLRRPDSAARPSGWLRGGLSRQFAVDKAKQFPEIEWLPHSLNLRVNLPVDCRTYNDDRYLLQCLVQQATFQKLVTVHDGHAQIHQDQIGVDLGGDVPQGVGSVGGLIREVAFVGKSIAKNGSNLRIVVNDQDARRPTGSLRRSEFDRRSHRVSLPSFLPLFPFKSCAIGSDSRATGISDGSRASANVSVCFHAR